MRSFSILRTNVGLTTNVKIMVDSKYDLYLESIDSVPELSASRFKKFLFNKDNFYDELVPYFFKDLPIDIAFAISYTGDASNMSSDFANQYDDTYQMGARNIIDNKNYLEEYEYFAPLYIFKQSFPKGFMIFRVDGPGLSLLDKNTFRQDFLLKFKAVKFFDLTRKSSLGEWVDKNFISNRLYPNHSLEVDFRNLEFSKWIGIDYNSGGFTYRSQFLDQTLESENTLFDFEKLFFDGYKTSGIIFPQILNFSFLFDDTPATPTSLRKWSMNRYCGFYIQNMDLIDSISPFSTQPLREDVSISDGNILESSIYGDPFLLGFKDNETMRVEYNGSFLPVERFSEPQPVMVQQISLTSSRSRVSEDQRISKSIYKYRIISDTDLSGLEGQLNQKQCYVDSENRILKMDGSTYSIVDFELGDINLIEIDGVYHNLIMEDGYVKIFSDYGFTFRDKYRFEYFINYPDPAYSKYIDLSKNATPFSFNIYRISLLDIKDFDTQIIESELSKFEYEKRNSISKTEEPKMYSTDLRSASFPPTFNDYIYNDSVELIPCSSDYTSNLETFRIVNGDLSELWRKNPVHCRFSYQNSLSISDYPYLLNNNSVHEPFNRSADTKSILPDRKARNLDYFYTINSGTTSYLHHSLHVEKNHGSVQDTSFRFELDKYLNVATYSVGTQSATYSFDYFNYFFGATQSFLNGEIVINSQKFSYFDVGDQSIPNSTVFRGIKFKIMNVDNIKLNSVSIENISVVPSDDFSDYKFSILMNRNLQEVNFDGLIQDVPYWGYFIDNQYNSGTVSFLTSLSQTPSNINTGDVVEIRQFYPYINQSYDGVAEVTYVGGLNFGGYGFEINKPFEQSTPANPGYYMVNMQWKTVNNWEPEMQYHIGDLVLYDDSVYEVIVENTVTDPLENPITNTSEYMIYSGSALPFWVPGLTYSPGSWVYRQNEYYYRNTVPDSDGYDFWNPSSTYSTDQVVLFGGRYYRNNSDQPYAVRPYEQRRELDISVNADRYWVEDRTFGTEVSSITYSSLWNVVPIWDVNHFYSYLEYVVSDDVLYQWGDSNSDSTVDDVPGVSQTWNRMYSFVPDTNFIYASQSNPFVKFGDNHYLCSFNRDLTLNSGLTVYINKKWKNILVNIFINDNTIENIDNHERDDLYIGANSRITAANFIRQLNDLDSKYDFADYTSYVVIEEDGSVKKYDFGNNFDKLPHILVAEEADDFDLRDTSLIYKPRTLDKNTIKPSRELSNGNVDNLQKINFYNDIPLAVEIDRSTNEVGMSNKSSIGEVSRNSDVKSKFGNSEKYYRFSGPYMPLFYDIQLFRAQGPYDDTYGNYRFDESLSLFGVMKQRIISKINRKENVLKLKNTDSNSSIYPMLDEFGYTISDFFIFKSTWDFEYHIECSRPVISSVPTFQNINSNLYVQEIVKKFDNSL